VQGLQDLKFIMFQWVTFSEVCGAGPCASAVVGRPLHLGM
jgi:hypothetical protein